MNVLCVNDAKYPGGGLKDSDSEALSMHHTIISDSFVVLIRIKI